MNDNSTPQQTSTAPPPQAVKYDTNYINPQSKEINDAVKPIHLFPDKKLLIILLSLFLITAISGLYLTFRNTNKYRELIKPRQLLLPTPIKSSK